MSRTPSITGATMAAAGPTATWDTESGDGFVKPDDRVRLVYGSMTTQ